MRDAGGVGVEACFGVKSVNVAVKGVVIFNNSRHTQSRSGTGSPSLFRGMYSK